MENVYYVICDKKSNKAVGFDAFGMYLPKRFSNVHIFDNKEEAEAAIEVWWEFNRNQYEVRKIQLNFVE